MQVPRYRGLQPKSAGASAAAKGASRKKDTSCELLLRKALSHVGLRYRLDAAGLPGRPDIVFRRSRVAVFVDGDFWHGRDLRNRLRRLRKGHNSGYWVEKIRSNVKRDRRVMRQLEKSGWLVMRFWETDVHAKAPGIANRIKKTVRTRTMYDLKYSSR